MASSDVRHVIIVGAGCFGLSTALHLLRPYFPSRKHSYKVTIVERASTIPAPDAASSDINKVVRSAYSDLFYAELGKEAIQRWKSEREEIWNDAYHESGVFVAQDWSKDSYYAESAYKNELALGSRLEYFADNNLTAQKYFPASVKTGPLISTGYFNKDGGWAWASGGIMGALAKVKEYGAEIRTGSGVSEFLFDQSDPATVKGVRLTNGEVLEADFVIVATGSWTPSNFVGLGLHEKLLATGQSIATIHLSPEELARYKDCPVVVDYVSGFYMFPPNADGIVKIAIHHSGHTFTPSTLANPESGAGIAPGPGPGISTPRTITSHPKDGLAIPREMATELREGLRKVYPELADREFLGTRMCWYCDVPSADWLIDFHPKHPGLLLATGGSGHAYKFLPVIGSLIVRRLEGSLPPEVVKRFAFDSTAPHDPSRLNPVPRILDESDLYMVPP